MNNTNIEAFENIQLVFKCPKALDDLQPCRDNWYCDGCQQVVYDFRGMSEQAILDRFAKANVQLCGIYDTERLRAAPRKLKIPLWAHAAMFVFGISAISAGCGQKKEHTIGEAVVPIATDTVRIPQTVGFVLPPETIRTFPVYKNGGEKAFKAYVYHHLKHDSGFTGRVIVKFVVETNGAIGKVTVLKGGNTQLNKRLIRIIKRSPEWTPGTSMTRVKQDEYHIFFNFPQTAE